MIFFISMNRLLFNLQWQILHTFQEENTLLLYEYDARLVSCSNPQFGVLNCQLSILHGNNIHDGMLINTDIYRNSMPPSLCSYTYYKMTEKQQVLFFQIFDFTRSEVEPTKQKEETSMQQRGYRHYRVVSYIFVRQILMKRNIEI